MRETTPAAMPPCFDRWCQKFDDLLKNKSQKREFRHYLGGLLGESERKNVYQMALDSVGVTYHKLHHFVTEATWSVQQINERRLEVMNKCNQTRISRGFSLIIDDSGHRKSGNFTLLSGSPIHRRDWENRQRKCCSNNSFVRWEEKFTFRHRIISAW